MKPWQALALPVPQAAGAGSDGRTTRWGACRRHPAAPGRGAHLRRLCQAATWPGNVDSSIPTGAIDKSGPHSQQSQAPASSLPSRRRFFYVLSLMPLAIQGLVRFNDSAWGFLTLPLAKLSARCQAALWSSWSRTRCASVMPAGQMAWNRFFTYASCVTPVSVPICSGP